MKTLTLRSLLLGLCVLTGATAFGAANDLSKEATVHRYLSFLFNKRFNDKGINFESRHKVYIIKTFKDNGLELSEDQKNLFNFINKTEVENSLGRQKIRFLQKISKNTELSTIVKDELKAAIEEEPVKPPFAIVLPGSQGEDFSTGEKVTAKQLQDAKELEEAFGELLASVEPTPATLPKGLPAADTNLPTGIKPESTKLPSGIKPENTPVQNKSGETPQGSDIASPEPQASGAAVLSNDNLEKIYRRTSSQAGRDGIKADVSLLNSIQASANAGNATARDILKKIGSTAASTQPAKAPTQAQPSAPVAQAPAAQTPAPQTSGAAVLSNAELEKIYRRTSSLAGRDGIKANVPLLNSIQASAKAGNATAKDILTKLK